MRANGTIADRRKAGCCQRHPPNADALEVLMNTGAVPYFSSVASGDQAFDSNYTAENRKQWG